MEEDFRAASLEYNSIEVQLKEFKKSTKELLERKKLLGKFIREYMAANHKDVVKVSSAEGRTGGQIKLNKRKFAVPLTRLELVRILTDYFDGDDDSAKKVTNFIFKNRAKVERAVISHRVEK